MYKNRSLFFLIIFKIVAFNTFLHAVEFNSEAYEFSQKKTIESWIAPEFNNKEMIAKVQKIISNMMPQNSQGIIDNKVVYKVKNNDNDQRFYGRTFCSIKDIQLSFLKEIRRRCDDNTSVGIKVLEIGAAGGAFSYLIGLALGNNNKHILVVNDLSVYEIQKAAALFKERENYVGLSYKNVIFDAGDAKNILDRKNDFLDQFDLCYIQNVEHFMNPVEHQQFLKVVLKLLALEGKVFCTAHTIPIGYGIKGNGFFDLYIKMKNNKEIYPMFLATEAIVYELIDQPGAFLADKELKKVYRPKEESQICTGFTNFLNVVKINGQLFRKLNQVNIANNFTPTIYTNAFQLAADQLKIKIQKIDGYFMDHEGNKYITFNNNQKILFASIIISKLKQS